VRADTDARKGDIGDDWTVNHVGRARVIVVLAMSLYLAGVVILICSAFTPNRTHPPSDVIATIALSLPSVWLGLLVARRRPGNPTGPALVALAMAIVLAFGVESWGGTFATADPWPGARLAATVAPGVWVVNLAGFFLLCQVFPDGPLRGRGWRALPWFGLASAVFMNAMISLVPENFRRDGGVLPGATPLQVPGAVEAVLIAAAALSLVAALVMAVASIVIRYRRGDSATRLQLRWMMLGAGSVPVLLVAGWLAQDLGASVSVAFTGFIVAILVLLPLAVTVAILKHDLFDVDRLLSETAAWLITSLVAAGVFALIAMVAADLSFRNSRAGAVGAAFLVAVALLPAHRWIHRLVGRVVDRDRAVSLIAMREFVRRVRDGQAQAEEVEAEMRSILGDPALRVLLLLPGEDSFVDLDGAPVQPPPTPGAIPLRSGASDVGIVLPGQHSTRGLRRTRELLVEARMPIEVARLRLQLHAALEDARASRARIVAAAVEERQRLERDLHDGAQQRIVAIGMRLRSIQRTHAISPGTDGELDMAVEALESVVAELRRLAHGIRPQGLDDGLEAAVRALTANSPIPVTVEIGAAGLSETLMTTAYFVIAEGLTNTLKHARASYAHISYAATPGGHIIEVRDDGIGGVDGGLTAMRDRVTALGGRLEVISPAGHGTVLRAEL
jgi:signal transduction histidine kinase